MISVLLAEDMHMVRGALVALLDLEPDLRVVAQVAAGTDIVPAARRTRPDVAVIDIDLPGIDGITAAGLLREQLPGCRVLLLTSIARPATVRRALAARTDGLILKDARADELAGAVRAVAAGRRVVDGQVALAAWEAVECPLTPRELDVLRRAADGDDPTEIATALHLSVGTVRNYLTAVATKLSARNRLDAVSIARSAGWL